MNKISNIYRLYSQSKMSNTSEDAKAFLARYRVDNKQNDNVLFWKHYNENMMFIEEGILKLILSTNQLEMEPEYLSAYTRNMSASGLSGEDDALIMMDELLDFSVLSFFLTVFSLINNQESKNFERCIKNFIVLLDLQGRRGELVTYNIPEVYEMIGMPEPVLNLAMDAYWCAWTFVIGHELYHIHCKEKMDTYTEEYQADAYGYHVLINMIQAQKQGVVPDHLCVYYEDLYLAPIMLFEFFRLLDVYKSLCGMKSKQPAEFTPVMRQDHIFELFDTEIPNNFQTEKGNSVLNLFLDAVERLEHEMLLKIKKCKLNFIIETETIESV